MLVSAMAVVISWQLRAVIRDRSESTAQANAAAAIELVMVPILAEPGIQRRDPVEVAAPTPQLNSLSERSVIRHQILSVTAWLPNGLVVFSTATGAAGNTEELPESAAQALQGRNGSHLDTSDRVRMDSFDRELLERDDRVLVVDLPLYLADSPTPAAVVDMTTPYGPIADAIAHDTRMVARWLSFGLLILYLGLFRLVATASKSLRRQAALNRQLALNDTLTGLANRSLLHERAATAIADATDHRVALLLLDLDRFKEINDTLGHHHGDRLLQLVGPRLRSVLRAGDTVARLGGDEFVVLLADVETKDTAVIVAHKLLRVLGEPFTIDQVDLDVGCSIGIAITPEDGSDFEMLLQHADVAMYAAKAAQSGIALYDAEHDVHTPARLTLLGDLRRGIESGQLRVHYQPKADLETGAVTEVEALVRWAHPTRGLVPPDDFIPLAERSGLIRPLTLAVLDASLAQARRWSDDGRPLHVAVNISARCLLDLDFVDEVRGALDRHGVQAGLLQLEITESSVMVDPDRALSVLEALTALGTTLSVDDYGTGYSSMSYLQRLPATELKIDRSFVSGLRGTSEVLVASSIDLARNLGLRVVAEGVEDAWTWERLRDLGCHAAQGYLVSRPLPAEELDAWLTARDRALVGALV